MTERRSHARGGRDRLDAAVPALKPATATLKTIRQSIEITVRTGRAKSERKRPARLRLQEEQMQQKQLVYDSKQGRYVERYVDKGPGRALPNHGQRRARVTVGHPVAKRRALGA